MLKHTVSALRSDNVELRRQNRRFEEQELRRRLRKEFAAVGDEEEALQVALNQHLRRDFRFGVPRNEASRAANARTDSTLSFLLTPMGRSLWRGMSGGRRPKFINPVTREFVMTLKRLRKDAGVPADAAAIARARSRRLGRVAAAADARATFEARAAEAKARNAAVADGVDDAPSATPRPTHASPVFVATGATTSAKAATGQMVLYRGGGSATHVGRVIVDPNRGVEVRRRNYESFV